MQIKLNTFRIVEDDGTENPYTVSEDQEHVTFAGKLNQEIYNSDYIQFNTHHDSDKTERLNEIRSNFIKMIPGMDKGRTLLDYGYGNGAFLDYMSRNRKNGLLLRGYDLSNQHGADPYRGRRSLIHEVVIFENMPTKDNDIVTMFDVLEHIPNPCKFILDIRPKAFVITIPLFHREWINNLIMFANWKHRRPVEHIHHWTEKGLDDLMISCDYKKIGGLYSENYIRKTTQPGYPDNNVYTGIYVHV